MSGFTKEETYLHSLGQESFLRFWSLPNLYRDQGDCDKGGDGKEICDLTVIFDNNVIFFSDKKVKFNTETDLETAWCRWARKAIKSSVKQISGARSWFAKFPDRIFTDKKCTKSIPLETPNKEIAQYHNIVVCHGIEDQLLRFNSEASFSFDNSIKDDQHWSKDECKPFVLGQIFDKDFVHIFNESTITMVLEEFDTSLDFRFFSNLYG